MPRKRVLIVCEGEETEKRYFNALVTHLELTNIDVEICTDCGSAPISVVIHAEKRVRSERGDDGAGFDIVFCVFDCDEHESYFEAIAKLDGLRKARSFPVSEIYAITSNPCIEFWFLLHFKYSRAPIVRANGKSPGGNAVSILKSDIAEFSDYKKAVEQKHVSILIENTAEACENAKRVQKDFMSTGEENPLTLVHEMIEKLKSLPGRSTD